MRYTVARHSRRRGSNADSFVGAEKIASVNAMRLASRWMDDADPGVGDEVSIHKGDGWRAKIVCRWTYRLGEGWHKDFCALGAA